MFLYLEQTETASSCLYGVNEHFKINLKWIELNGMLHEQIILDEIRS